MHWMVDQDILIKSKARVKKKFLISFLSWGFALSSAFITSDNYQLNIIIALAFSVLIIQTERIPRYWRLNRSNDLEVIDNGLSFNSANKQTTLPFSVPGIIIILIVMVFIMYAIVEVRPDRILLGLSVLVSIMNNSRKEIIFDYDSSFYYGLWKAESFYDSDRQPMKPTRFDYYESENGIEKIRITDKSGYYDMYRKNYLETAWDRIQKNLDRIAALNAQPEVQQES